MSSNILVAFYVRKNPNEGQSLCCQEASYLYTKQLEDSTSSCPYPHYGISIKKKQLEQLSWKDVCEVLLSESSKMQKSIYSMILY